MADEYDDDFEEVEEVQPKQIVSQQPNSLNTSAVPPSTGRGSDTTKDDVTNAPSSVSKQSSRQSAATARSSQKYDDDANQTATARAGIPSSSSSFPMANEEERVLVPRSASMSNSKASSASSSSSNSRSTMKASLRSHDTNNNNNNVDAERRGMLVALQTGTCKQSGSQTRADDASVGVQCDSVDKVTMAIQVPDDLGVSSSRIGGLTVSVTSSGSGNSNNSSKSSSNAAPRSTGGGAKATSTTSAIILGVGAPQVPPSGALPLTDPRFMSFLRVAGRVCGLLCEETVANSARKSAVQSVRGGGSTNEKSNSSSSSSSHHHHHRSFYPPSLSSFTSVSLLLPQFPLFQGRKVTAITQGDRSSSDIILALGPMSIDTIATLVKQDGVSITPKYRDACLLCFLSTETKALHRVLVCWTGGGNLTSIAICTTTPSRSSNSSGTGSKGGNTNDNGIKGEKTRTTSAAVAATSIIDNIDSSLDGTIVIAGGDAGALYAWNLSEPIWLHPTVYGIGKSASSSSTTLLLISSGIRAPSFSTHAAVPLPSARADANTGPQGKIVRICPLDGGYYYDHQRNYRGNGRGWGGSGSGGQSAGLRVGAGLASLLDGGGGGMQTSGGASDGNIGSTTTTSSSSSNNNTNSLSIASMDEYGTVDLWVILKLPIPPSPGSIAASAAAAAATSTATTGGLMAAADSFSYSAAVAAASAVGRGMSLASLVDDRDFGRGVTGTLRLVHTGIVGITDASLSLSLQSRQLDAISNISSRISSSNGSSMQSSLARDLDASPSDTSQFIAAFESGLLVQITRQQYDAARLLSQVTNNKDSSGASTTSAAATERSNISSLSHMVSSSAFTDILHNKPRVFFPPIVSDVLLLDLLQPLHLSHNQQQQQENAEPTHPPAKGILEATCVKYHPHPSIQGTFLAGFSNGQVALYSTSHSSPLVSWSPIGTVSNSSGGSRGNASPILFLNWINNRPSCFLAVDMRGTVAIWDLIVSTLNPVFAATLDDQQQQNENHNNNDDVVVSATCNGGTGSEPTRVTLIVAFASGRIHTLTLHPSFVVPAKDANEVFAMQSILERIR